MSVNFAYDTLHHKILNIILDKAICYHSYILFTTIKNILAESPTTEAREFHTAGLDLTNFYLQAVIKNIVNSRFLPLPTGFSISAALSDRIFRNPESINIRRKASRSNPKWNTPSLLL
jgi:hypothetical protein